MVDAAQPQEATDVFPNKDNALSEMQADEAWKQSMMTDVADLQGGRTSQEDPPADEEAYTDEATLEEGDGSDEELDLQESDGEVAEYEDEEIYETPGVEDEAEAAEADDDDEVIVFSDLEDPKDLKFKIVADGEEQVVDLGDLVQNHMPREKYLQVTSERADAIRGRDQAYGELQQLRENYQNMEDLALDPRAFVKEFLHMKSQQLGFNPAIANAVDELFDDPEFQFDGRNVQLNAQAVIQNREQQKQAAAQRFEAERQMAIQDMQTIKGMGFQLSQPQIDLLWEKMQEHSRSTGENLRPLTAFNLYQKDVLGKVTRKNGKPISSSAKARIKRLKKRPAVESPNSSPPAGSKGSSLEQEARELQASFRRA